ncbi:hypothetical protein B0O99DRAFT_634161 [Bisporella sp. PMI_857]|nr:hypothetical protein B0O99DRAFT_634161 [Bisporella sp. PMI_857]
MAPQPPPKKSSEPAASGSNGEVQPKDVSKTQWLKNSGFRNMHEFMASYGLKMGNDDDYEEAQSIYNALRNHEQYDWEARRKT